MMLESLDYLEQERRRLDEQARQLAKDKERIVPQPRHADRPQVPDATPRDFRRWQWSILALAALFNLTAAESYRKSLGNLPEVMHVSVGESQVRRTQDVVTGEDGYLIELSADDLRPYIPRQADPLPLAAWGVVNALLLAALVYARYRIWRAPTAA